MWDLNIKGRARSSIVMNIRSISATSLGKRKWNGTGENNTK